MSPVSLEVLRSLLGITGLTIAAVIYWHKYQQRPLPCLKGDHCQRVVTSQYSRVFGVELEVYGATYYVSVLVLQALSWMLLRPVAATIGIVILSSAAMVVSVILTLLQLIKLRSWCEWCLASAAVTLGVFIVSFQLFIGTQGL